MFLSPFRKKKKKTSNEKFVMGNILKNRILEESEFFSRSVAKSTTQFNKKEKGAQKRNGGLNQSLFKRK